MSEAGPGAERPWRPWAVLLVAALVAAVAAFTVTALHHQADRSREVSETVRSLETRANRVSTLEWQAVATHELTPEAQNEVFELLTSMEQDVRGLGEQRSATGVARVTGALERYAPAVREEFRLLAAGKADEAEEVDETRVDPAFEELREAVDAAVSANDRAARTAERNAQAETIAVIVMSGLLIGLLFVRFEAARQAVGVARVRERARQESEEHIRALLRNSSDLVVVLGEDGSIRYVNEPVERMLGFVPDELLGKDFIELLAADQRPQAKVLIARALRSAEPQEPAAWRLRRSDGRFVETETIVNDLSAELQGEGVVLNVRDVSERQALEQELRRQAFHDALTGLPNRALFEDRTSHALFLAERHRHRVAVLFLDLDYFKHVNDSLGHAAGDALLTAVAERLQSCLRESDTVARLGGDEFAVLMEHLDEAAQALDAGERILEVLQPPVALHGRQIQIGASVGVALSDPIAEAGRTAGEQTVDLLRCADIAMYVAKGQGKNRVELFSASMHTAALEKLELRAELQRAIEQQEFVLHYQPIIALDSDEVAGFEALVRWQHPERGLVPPMEFIPLAEETHLIVPLGEWVLREACRQARAWADELPAENPPYVSVNVAGNQLQQARFLDKVREALAHAGLDPRSLMLEVTESSLIQDSEGNAARLQELRDLGVRLAIDDFGTGYSALNYLRRFRMDVLKIDRSFVRGVASPGEEAALVRAMVHMGASLGLEVVAEGVELEDQRDALRALECGSGQGYLFARPLTPADAHALLEGRSVAAAL